LSTGTNSVLSVGMPVLVELGYDFNYSTYFQGFITDIDSKTPVTIECQDAFWFLKQVSGDFTTSKGGTLEDVFTEIERIYRASTIYATHGVDITFTPVPNTVIGKVKSDNVSLAFAIQSLKKFGVISFMRGNTLYSGLPYYDDQINEVNRQFDWNIIDDSLEQKNALDTKVKLVVKCLDNKNLANVEVGDAEGDTISYLVSGVNTQSEMRALGEKELPRYKFDGWKGSFTTFGDEFIKHGDVINLTDKVIKDRNGKYYVKKVSTKFGISGFRNTIDLDKKYNP
jgi:hypothetical protein